MSPDSSKHYTAHSITIPVGQAEITIETGKLAKQAAGAVTVRAGNTVVLVAAVGADKPSPGKDFFPLMVDYRERFSASGRFPGGFFKREGRPSDGETLKARLIDRTIRPMFPSGFLNEVQVYVTVLSADPANPAEILALVGASAALYISDIPFPTPVAGVRIGRVEGKLVVNPSAEQIEAGDLDLVVGGHANGINMVEAGGVEIKEEKMLEALELAHDTIKSVVAQLEKFRAVAGKEKKSFVPPAKNHELHAAVEALSGPHLTEIAATHEKKARDLRVEKAIAEITAAIIEKFPEQEGAIKNAFLELDELAMRRRVVNTGVRADGRLPTEIRPIWSEVDSLPGPHGVAIFTRGQTQALASVTLGSVDDQQKIDDMLGESTKRFMLHYNFPSFSVGEVRPPRGPGRREIGHGALAERALLACIPPKDKFPYTVRVVVDILESNGSSSMATVCSGSLAMFDAGIPLNRPVAGIAMGLITVDDKVAILSDIQGIEDHCGDMDFKVAGTSQGINALQMDIKIEGVTREILARALEQARAGREFILGKMAETMSEKRAEMKPHTPRIEILKINTEKIRDVIGPGGKIIRSITEATGCKIDIEDDGTVFICSSNAEGMRKAVETITHITTDLQEGQTYTGKVVRVMESGVIVEVFPGKDGMVHISELDEFRVERCEDICREGDTLLVKVIEVDKARGRVRMSRRAALADIAEGQPPVEGIDGGDLPPADGEAGEGGGEAAGGGERGHGGGGHRGGGHRGGHGGHGGPRGGGRPFRGGGGGYGRGGDRGGRGGGDRR